MARKKECGNSYSFCGKIKTENNNYCNYPKIKLSSRTHEAMIKYMPSIKFDGCLERHQWWKHGTCTRYDSDSYYKIAVSYVTDFNESKFFTQYLRHNLNNLIKKEELFEFFDTEFGFNSHKKLQLICKKNYLIELRIALPSEISDGRTNLIRLIRLENADKVKQDQCPNKFILP